MSARRGHLRPTAPLASRALLCGDPGRCLSLATLLLDRPLMFNHARGLWGYTGAASDGEPLTIQATGLGAASAAIVTAELCALGLVTFVRVGTARSLAASGAPVAGEVLAVTGALAEDGPSRALGAVGAVLPDVSLTARLFAELGGSALVASVDLPRPEAGVTAALTHRGAGVCDLQTAAVLQVAHTRGLAAAAVLVVTGPTSAPTLDDETLLACVTIAANAAAGALGLPPRRVDPVVALPGPDRAGA